VATAVIMPRQGQSVESCLIGKWYKNKGDKVSIGDILFTYETDKATFEEESKVDGVMLEIFFEEGDDVECLTNVCVIGNEGESVEEFDPKPTGQGDGSSAGQGDGSSGSFAKELSATLTVDIKRQGDGSSNHPLSVDDTLFSKRADAVSISPRAQSLAEKTLADLRYAVPTGPNGRIIERDVQAVLSQGHRTGQGDGSSGSRQGDGSSGFAGPTRQGDGSSGFADPSSSQGCKDVTLDYSVSTGDCEIVPLSNIRKIIAKTMCVSLSNSAQLTSHSSFDATDIFELRKKFKGMDDFPAYAKITITDIIVYAASRILPKHRSINAHFLGDKMALFNNAHIGVAVDTPRGLLVPTIFNANSMSLSELSAHAKVLFEKCKQGSIEPDSLKGASFTISNLGSLGVEMFTPILNPPQTGILGVCSTIERTKDGKPYPALGLSLTYDHQALDGADSARFLRDLVQYLESFSSHYLQDGGLS